MSIRVEQCGSFGYLAPNCVPLWGHRTHLLPGWCAGWGSAFLFILVGIFSRERARLGGSKVLFLISFDFKHLKTPQFSVVWHRVTQMLWSKARHHHLGVPPLLKGSFSNRNILKKVIEERNQSTKHGKNLLGKKCGKKSSFFTSTWKCLVSLVIRSI